MKTCFKCNEEKPSSEFYKHSGMEDGLLNKCKDCTKADVRANRRKKVDSYRAYDRERGNRQAPEYFRSLRNKYPNQAKAQRKVAYEVSKGRLTMKPCEMCGDSGRTHGHHDDYSKPLDIRWLCAACHRQWHEEHGEGLNR